MQVFSFIQNDQKNFQFQIISPYLVNQSLFDKNYLEDQDFITGVDYYFNSPRKRINSKPYFINK